MWSETCPNIKKYKKLTLPCTVAHQILLKSSTTLVILTEIKFTIYFWWATWCLYSLCTNPHKGLCPYSFKKVLRLQLVLIFNFFYNLLFQKSAHHWKKSKQIFDITAESCYHSEHFLVIESTSAVSYTHLTLPTKA